MAVACVVVLCGAALNARVSEPTAEAAESSVEAFGEQALTVGPSPLPGPPPAAPHSWTHGSSEHRIENPELDVPVEPPEFV